jgi:hypothetical protein
MFANLVEGSGSASYPESRRTFHKEQFQGGVWRFQTRANSSECFSPTSDKAKPFYREHREDPAAPTFAGKGANLAVASGKPSTFQKPSQTPLLCFTQKLQRKGDANAGSKIVAENEP